MKFGVTAARDELGDLVNVAKVEDESLRRLGLFLLREMKRASESNLKAVTRIARKEEDDCFHGMLVRILREYNQY